MTAGPIYMPLGGIWKGTFEIPLNISYPHTERLDFHAKNEIWVNSSYAFFSLIMALWCNMALQHLAIIGSGNGLMPEGITATNID